MAIVVYKCNTCKRTIETIKNSKGLEIIDRCTITQGCRGHLYKIHDYPDYIRGTLPDPVSGLEDWVQRKVLYNHIQSIEKSTWTIEHNLGTSPAVNVFVNQPLIEDPNNLEEILPTDIVVINSDTIQLNFDRPWSGIAQLIARTSDPDLISTTEEDTSVEPITLTNNSELTIATKSSVFPLEQMGIEIIYSTITGSSLTHTYIFNSSPSEDSPWIDYDRIIIGGKNYTTRSTNIHISEMVDGIIPDGASFQFGNIIQITNSESYVTEVNSKDVVVLLADSPGETSDKNYNQFFDITPNQQSNLIYTANELFVNETEIQNTYPPIQAAK